MAHQEMAYFEKIIWPDSHHKVIVRFGCHAACVSLMKGKRCTGVQQVRDLHVFASRLFAGLVCAKVFGGMCMSVAPHEGVGLSTYPVKVRTTAIILLD